MLVGPCYGRVVVRAGRVEPPFEHVAFDHESPWYLTELSTLRGRADIDEQAAVGVQRCRLVGADAAESSASPLYKLVDAARSGLGLRGRARHGAPSQSVSTRLSTRPAGDVW
jgi:hypothetical protein